VNGSQPVIPATGQGAGNGPVVNQPKIQAVPGQSAPAVQGSTPTMSQPAPAVQGSAPTMSQPAPKVQGSAPTMSQPAP
ncbi:hypothetical protein CN449_29770, partial [Bacillus thuringiensis]